MRLAVRILILACVSTPAIAQYPDGTLVMSSKPGTIVGNVAQRMATRAQGYKSRYTHVGIILGGRIYHADFPRFGAIAIGAHKRGEKADYYAPTNRYTAEQVAAMKAYAQSQVGQAYRLRGFIFRTDDDRYCSPFAKNVLKHAGHDLTRQDGLTPDNLIRALQ